MGFSREEAQRYLARHEEKEMTKSRDELEVIFKIPPVFGNTKYYEKYMQYNSDRELFFEKEEIGMFSKRNLEAHSKFFEARTKDRPEVEQPVFLTDTIWTFKRKVNDACELLSGKVKFGSHLYKTVKLGAGYKCEIEHEGKWYELQDNLTFSDYSQLGLNFKNSTKMMFTSGSRCSILPNSVRGKSLGSEAAPLHPTLMQRRSRKGPSCARPRALWPHGRTRSACPRCAWRPPRGMAFRWTSSPT